ncbi:CopD family protein [Streptomyces albus subsp. chlorinus]|uniref:CopD family protein n=1 Tax=Streptomyces albus TaxID=1888 RepID=UPI0031F66432
MSQPGPPPLVPPAGGRAGRGRHRAPRARRRTLVTGLLAGACVAVLAALALTGTDLATGSTHDVRIPGGGATTLLRSVLLAALCVQLGEVAGRRLARDVARTLPGGGADGPRQPSAWAAGAALAGMLAALGLASMAAAGDGRLTAALPELSEIWATRDGLLAFCEANGFLLAALCVFLARPTWAAVPLAGVIAGEAQRAHPEADTPALGIALTLVHLTSTVLWTGGLVHVLRTMRVWRLWHGEPGAARALLAAYARRAFWLLTALCATGTVSTLRKLPSLSPDAVASSAWGRILVVKLAVVALVAVCALFARRVLVRDRTRTSYTRILRPTAWELAALGAVLVLSALLTVAPVPRAG